MGTELEPIKIKINVNVQKQFFEANAFNSVVTNSFLHSISTDKFFVFFFVIILSIISERQKWKMKLVAVIQVPFLRQILRTCCIILWQDAWITFCFLQRVNTFTLVQHRKCLPLLHQNFDNMTKVWLKIKMKSKINFRRPDIVRWSNIFWDVTPCNALKVDRYFGGTHHLCHHQR